ncbi:MAG: TonB-dependent receptor [Pseudomonadales bacterium]|nr:TonB-dependent receptor [Pseudomonadales bacterium]
MKNSLLQHSLYALACAQTLLLLNFSAVAETELDHIETSHLFSMNLEQLMDIDVTTVSKHPERISDAPGIISIITKQDIKDYGAKDLLSILERSTSIQVYGSNFIPDNVVNLRGQELTHNANHLLILINGRPYRDSISGGLNFSLYKSFPIGLIERIEVIRGPGSVLYGTNAFAGIVNIITSKPDSDGKTAISASYGSFSSKKMELVHGAEGDNWYATGGAVLSKTDGWQMSLTDENGVYDSFDREDENKGFVLSGGYHAATVNIAYSDSTQANLGGVSAFPSDTIQVEKLFADIGYHQSFQNEWDVQYNITYNKLDTFAQSDTTIPGYAKDLLIETVAQGPFITKTLHTLLGATYEKHEGRLIGGIDFKTNWYSLYAQINYNPLHWLRLTAGLQCNNADEVSSTCSPRFSALFKLHNNWDLKLLYGEAFRAAYASEQGINLPFLIGNPELKPEKINTFDASLMYSGNIFYSSLTYYKSEADDLVGRSDVSPGLQQFTNNNAINYHGIEFEAKAHISHRIDLTGSMTWQESENHAGVKDVSFTPNFMAKLGVMYRPTNSFHIAIFDNYYGTPTPVSDVTSGVQETNPTPEAYHLMTANIAIDFSKLYHMPRLDSLKLSLFIDNVLDEDIHYPDFNRKKLNSLPIHSGRAIYIEVETVF